MFGIRLRRRKTYRNKRTGYGGYSKIKVRGKTHYVHGYRKDKSGLSNWDLNPKYYRD